MLVRHGQSEANLARELCKREKDGPKFTDDIYNKSGFQQKHSSKYKLTDTGRSQVIFHLHLFMTIY